MQEDVEDAVGIAERSVPRRLWEGEIVLRCAAWVAAIHGMTLVLVGSFTEEWAIPFVYLPIGMERIVAGTTFLSAAVMLMRRRGRWIVFSVALLHTIFSLNVLVAVASMLSERYGIRIEEGRWLRRMFFASTWGPPGVLGVLLPMFVAWAMLGRVTTNALCHDLRGVPLAPIHSIVPLGAGVRPWAAILVVVLSLVHGAQLLLRLGD